MSSTKRYLNSSKGANAASTLSSDWDITWSLVFLKFRDCAFSILAAQCACHHNFFHLIQPSEVVSFTIHAYSYSIPTPSRSFPKSIQVSLLCSLLPVSFSSNLLNLIFIQICIWFKPMPFQVSKLCRILCVMLACAWSSWKCEDATSNDELYITSLCARKQKENKQLMTILDYTLTWLL